MLNDMERDAELRRLLNHMPKAWQLKWCETDGVHEGCCCLGCANVGGGLAKAGFTKAEWRFVHKVRPLDAPKPNPFKNQ